MRVQFNLSLQSMLLFWIVTLSPCPARLSSSWNLLLHLIFSRTWSTMPLYCLYRLLSSRSKFAILTVALRLIQLIGISIPNFLSFDECFVFWVWVLRVGRWKGEGRGNTKFNTPGNCLNMGIWMPLPHYGCTDHFLDAFVLPAPSSIVSPLNCKSVGAENLSTRLRHEVMFGALSNYRGIG